MRNLFWIFSFILVIGSRAQPPERFYCKYGGDGDDIGYSGKPTLDRQYIVAGSSSSYGTHGNTDIYLTKIDSMGYQMWEKFYGGLGNDVGKAVIQLQDSGYVIAGYTSSFGAGGYDAIILRTDKKGDLVWQRTFGGQDWDFASDILLGPDNNLFVVGNTVSFGAGKKDGFALKYDLAGNELFHKFIGGAENDELRSIIVTNDNFLATVGYTESKGEINGDGYFLKLNLNADTIFTKTFGGPYKDYACDLVQNSSNEYMLCGAKTFSLNGKSKSYMFTISSIGDFAWDNNHYASSEDEHFESMTLSYQLPSLTAYLRDVPVPNFKQQGNLWLATPGGYHYKVNSFGGADDEVFYSIEGTKDGGFLVTGSTNSFGSKSKDIFMIKHDSTCFNYISIVDIEKYQRSYRSFFYNEYEKVFKFYFSDNDRPHELTMFDIRGNVVWRLENIQTDLQVNFNWLASDVYFVRARYKNGYYSHEKLIVR